MSHVPGLDGLPDDLYPGFGEHREIIKEALGEEAEPVWRATFLDVRMGKLYRKNEEVIARKTMHVLLLAIERARRNSTPTQ